MMNVTKTPIKTKDNDMTLKGPTTAHIELTSGCQLQCRHCYNFWRHDPTPAENMKTETLDAILDALIKEEVMHIIFTGGEPMLNYKNLLHGIRKVRDAGLSVSCNSNLMLATPEKMKELREAGLPHVLTSLNSFMPTINDYIVSTPGAFEKIVKGIKTSADAGIAISVNMIITRYNVDHIYQTAKLAQSLGARKFFATRVVPQLGCGLAQQTEFLVDKESAKIFKELERVERSLGMQVGTLIPYPSCFMEELGTRFEDFYSHGCPAGNKMISVNVNGDLHACVHESTNYGNILTDGLKPSWEKMQAWRDSYFPDDCKACGLFEDCNAGCRMMSYTHTGKMDVFDHLRKGTTSTLESKASSAYAGKSFSIPGALKFRKESDQHYVVERFGSEVLAVKAPLAEILIGYNKDGRTFSVEDLPQEYREDIDKLVRERLVEVKKE